MSEFKLETPRERRVREKAASAQRRAEIKAELKATREEQRIAKESPIAAKPPSEKQLRFFAEQAAQGMRTEVYRKFLKECLIEKRKEEKRARAKQKRAEQRAIKRECEKKKRAVKRAHALDAKKAKKLAEREREKADKAFVSAERRKKRKYQKRWVAQKRKKIKQALKALKRQHWLEVMQRAAERKAKLDAQQVLENQHKTFAADKQNGAAAGIFAADQTGAWLKSFIDGFMLRNEQLIAYALDAEEQAELQKQLQEQNPALHSNAWKDSEKKTWEFKE